jgi:hypothetical protein
MNPYHRSDLSKGTKVKTRKGSGFLHGEIVDAINTARPGLQPEEIFVIQWEDGAKEKWRNDTVQMGHLMVDAPANTLPLNLQITKLVQDFRNQSEACNTRAAGERNFERWLGAAEAWADAADALQDWLDAHGKEVTS